MSSNLHFFEQKIYKFVPTAKISNPSIPSLVNSNVRVMRKEFGDDDINRI